MWYFKEVVHYIRLERNNPVLSVTSPLLLRPLPFFEYDYKSYLNFNDDILFMSRINATSNV